MQHHPKHQRSFMHRELPPDACPLAVAERLPGISRTRALGLGAEVIGIEAFRLIAPNRTVAMKRRQKNQDVIRLADRVLAPDNSVLIRMHRKGGRRWP